MAPIPLRPPRVPLQRRRVTDARLCVPLRGRRERDMELHFLEASFYRRPDGSAVTAGRGAGRSGDIFYCCKARDAERDRDFLPCRYRVTDERGVRCQLCHGLTSVEVKCAKADGGEPAGSACCYAIPAAPAYTRPGFASSGSPFPSCPGSSSGSPFRYRPGSKGPSPHVQFTSANQVMPNILSGKRGHEVSTVLECLARRRTVARSVPSNYST